MTAAMTSGAVELEPYTDTLQHLRDELRLLDLRIGALLKRSTPRQTLAGLVVTDEEVAGLLSAPGAFAGDSGHDAEASRLDSWITAATQGAALSGVFLPLPELAARFGLTRLEQRLLMVCLAPELDRKYHKLYGYLHDDITSRRPSVGLALDLVCENVRERLLARGVFATDATLVRSGIVTIDDAGSPLIVRPLRLDDRIVDYLLGLQHDDPHVAAQRPLESLDLPAEVVARLCGFLHRHVSPESPDTLPALFYLRGPRGTETRQLAEAACTELGVTLLVANVERLLERPESFAHDLRMFVREAILLDAAVCLEHWDVLLGAAGSLWRLALEATDGRLTFLTGEAPWWAQVDLGPRMLAEIDIPVPGLALRKRSWERRLNGSAGRGIDVGALAAKFRFTAGQIELAASEAASRAWWQSPDDARIDMTSLDNICRLQSTPSLGTLAQRLEPRRGWPDLVLPADQLSHLQEFCNHARYRDVVYGTWSLDRKVTRGRGVSTLFCGAPGAGKTLAAEVIASELGLDLYKVDLSQVVSKFIGETEKQLRQVFDEAQGSDAILFFDEADALFGKRSEVKDAHDRYANIEIGYLLQRMEEYDGIAIMATNMRKSLDDAFIRRLQFIIEFPFPEAHERARMWRTHLPPQLPLASDLDLDFLAGTFKLSGGYICNAVVGAAFQAAAEGTPLGMRHVVRAVRREFQKMGRTCTDAEFGPFAALLGNSVP
jgi:hypothetical protein